MSAEFNLLDCNLFKTYFEGEKIQPMKKRRKLCYDFLSSIDQTGNSLLTCSMNIVIMIIKFDIHIGTNLKWILFDALCKWMLKGDLKTISIVYFKMKKKVLFNKVNWNYFVDSYHCLLHPGLSAPNFFFKCYLKLHSDLICTLISNFHFPVEFSMNRKWGASLIVWCENPDEKLPLKHILL